MGTAKTLFSMSDKLVFPELVFLNSYNGDFKLYFEAVYDIFKKSFITSQPRYEGLKVCTQKHPLVDGIHRTFYHITHEGEIEVDRNPDLRRMERIRFPKFLIENSHHVELLVWEKEVKSDNRIHILNEIERYLIVLTEREGFYLLWTAFYIEYDHTLRKKIKEYQNYIKAKAV